MTAREYDQLPPDAEERKTHDVCNYCDMVRPRNELRIATIRRHPKQRHLEMPLPYCIDKGCAGFEQMGMEG